MKKLITLLLIIASFGVQAQVNWTNIVGAFQSKDTTGGKKLRISYSNGIKQPFASVNSDNFFTQRQTSNRFRSGIANIYEKTNFLASDTITQHAWYGFLDNSIVNYPSNAVFPLLQAHASFDAAPKITGLFDSDHHHAFQDASEFDGSGVLTFLTGYYTLPTVSGTGLVDDMKGFAAFTPAGTGSIKSYYGFFAAGANNRADSLNYAFYSEGSAPSRLGGSLTVMGSVNVIGSATNSIFSTGNDITGKIQATGSEVQIASTYGTTGSFVPLNFYTSDVSRFQIAANGIADFALSPTIGGASLNSLYIQNGTSLQSSSNFYISGTGRATNFGASIAPNANAYYTSAANTTTIGQLLLTPSATDYTGTEPGMIWNNAGALKMYDSGVKNFGFTSGALTSGRIPYITTGGLIKDESGFEYNETTNSISVTGAVIGSNLNINGTQSTITSNTNIVLQAAGSNILIGPTVNLQNTPPTSAGNYGVLTRNTSTGDVEKVTTATVAGTGWASYVDNAYTVGSPFTVASGVTSTLPNNSATTVTTYLPVGVTSLYNSGTSKITPAQTGDSYGISIRFKAKSSSAADFFDFGIDIGGSVGVIFKQTKSLLKAANTEMNFSIDLNAYSLATFVANGGLIKLTAGNGTLSVYDIIFDIFRTHKAN